MKLLKSLAIVAIGAAIPCTTAAADVMIMQSAAPAPTYSTVLNFDEPGGPTGANVPNNSWAGAPWNIPVFQSGEGSNFVGDLSGATGQGTNAYYGPYGVFINFGDDLTEMSFQGWDSSGPPSPFGGGALVYLLDNGNDVGFLSVTPAWGGAGDSWFNITTSGGTVFDEMRWLGFGFFPESVVDNLSWNVVPEPASLMLFAFGVLALVRRRMN
jgi:hypothetical protein